MGEVSYISVDNNPLPPPQPLCILVLNNLWANLCHMCVVAGAPQAQLACTRVVRSVRLSGGGGLRFGCARPFAPRSTSSARTDCNRRSAETAAALSVMRNDRPFEYTHREKKTLKHRTNIACNMEHASTEMDRIKGAHILYA